MKNPFFFQTKGERRDFLQETFALFVYAKFLSLIYDVEKSNETRRHPEGLAANFVFLFHFGQERFYFL